MWGTGIIRLQKKYVANFQLILPYIPGGGAWVSIDYYINCEMSLPITPCPACMETAVMVLKVSQKKSKVLLVVSLVPGRVLE